MRVEFTFDGKTSTVDAEGGGVDALRRSIAEREGVPAGLLRLTCGGRELCDSR